MGKTESKSDRAPRPSKATGRLDRHQDTPSKAGSNETRPLETPATNRHLIPPLSNSSTPSHRRMIKPSQAEAPNGSRAASSRSTPVLSAKRPASFSADQPTPRSVSVKRLRTSAKSSSHSYSTVRQGGLPYQEQDEDEDADQSGEEEGEEDNSEDETYGEGGKGKGENNSELEDDLAVQWEESAKHLREARPKPPADVLSLQRQLKDAHLGAALVRFSTVGGVRGVVDMSPDPNQRGNPRPIVSQHVENLYQSLRRPGMKTDHEFPAVLTTRPSVIHPECLIDMKGKDSRDITQNLPYLKLIRPHGKREDKLESCLWSGRINGTLLTQEQKNDMLAELQGLRSERAMANLMNGSHRFHAMEKLAADLAERQGEVNRLLQMPEDQRDDDFIRSMVARLNEDALQLTWRVDVYDEDKINADPKLKYALVKNEDEKPAQGMGAGEKAWWLAGHFSVQIEKEIAESGYKSREEAASAVAAKWQEETGDEFSVGIGEDVLDSSDPKARSARDEPANSDSISKLFKESNCMEMVMGTCQALGIYNNCLTRSQATHMLKPSGASLVAHFWLAAMTAIKIFNVQDPDRLTDAELYVNGAMPLTPDGESEARQHWIRIHARPERTPQPLSQFTRASMQAFDDRYQELIRRFSHPTRGLDLADPEVILAMRNIFEEMGELHLRDRKNQIQRAVCTSFRLYARLPLWTPQEGQEECFHPAALLPANGWMTRLQARWKDAGLSSDNLAVLECLLSRYNIIWTMGAAGTKGSSVNNRNWYERHRGTHQILRACHRAVEYGPMEARLSKAIDILEEPRFRLALKSLTPILGNELRTLIVECGASRSSGVSYPILNKIAPAWRDMFSSVEKIKSELARLRIALKSAVPKGKPKYIMKAAQSHPVSQIIHRSFWETFPIADWTLGWNSTNPEKGIKAISALVGWAFLVDRVWSVTLPRVMEECSNARWLLQTARDVHIIQAQPSPWVNDFPFPPPSPPSTPRLSPSQSQTQQATPGHMKAKSAACRKNKKKGPKSKPVVILEKPSKGKGKEPPLGNQYESAKPDKPKAKAPRASHAPSADVDHSDEEPIPPFPPSQASRYRETPGPDKGTQDVEPGNFEGGWDLGLDPGQRTKSQLTWESRPNHILSSHAHSTRVIDNLSGQVIDSRSRRGADPLVDIETLQRDIYVARTARLLSSIMEMSEDEAINEAALMAHTEALYEEDIAYVHGLTLKLQLRNTLTPKTRSHVNDTSFDLGPLSFPDLGGNEDEDSLLEVSQLLMNHFHPALGYGNSEAMADLNGIDGAAARSMVFRGRDEGKEVFKAASLRDTPTEPGELTKGLHQALGHPPSKRFLSGLATGPRRRPTSRKPLSSFSTGNFDVADRCKPLDPMDDVVDELNKALDEVTLELRSTWVEVQKSDVKAFENLRKRFEKRYGINHQAGPEEANQLDEPAEESRSDEDAVDQEAAGGNRESQEPGEEERPDDWSWREQVDDRDVEHVEHEEDEEEEEDEKGKNGKEGKKGKQERGDEEEEEDQDREDERDGRGGGNGEESGSEGDQEDEGDERDGEHRRDRVQYNEEDEEDPWGGLSHAYMQGSQKIESDGSQSGSVDSDHEEGSSKDGEDPRDGTPPGIPTSSPGVKYKGSSPWLLAPPSDPDDIVPFTASATKTRHSYASSRAPSPATDDEDDIEAWPTGSEWDLMPPISKKRPKPEDGPGPNFKTPKPAFTNQNSVIPGPPAKRAKFHPPPVNPNKYYNLGVSKERGRAGPSRV